MQTLIQATPQEFIDVVREAVRQELQAISVSSTQPTANEPANANYNKKEAADYLRVSLSTLERLIKSGAISSFNIGRLVFFKKEVLTEYLNKQG